MRRALFITDSGAMGGGQRVLLDLLLQIDRARIQPIIATVEGGELVDAARAAGIAAWRLPHGERLSGLPRRAGVASSLRAAPDLYGLVRWLAREARRERIDVVVTSTTESHVYGGLAGRRAGARVVARLHDIVSPASFGRAALTIDLLALRLLAHRVLAVSDAARDAVRRRGVHAETIYNGVEPKPRLSVAERAVVRAALGMSPDAFVVASVGRLTRWKGQHLLVAAAPELVRRNPRLRILIAGEAYFERGGYRDELERAIAAAGVRDVVRVLGHRSDVHEIVSASDLLVHTSIEPDPLPTVLLEAIAAGTYVVAADAGGVPEIVTSVGVGRLYPPGDVDALAAAVAPGAQDPAVARDVLERFSMTRYVEGMTRALE